MIARIIVMLVGMIALMDQLSSRLVQAVAMVGTDPRLLTAPVTIQDYWMMYLYVGSMVLVNAGLLCAFIDVLVFNRFLKIDLAIALTHGAVTLIWLIFSSVSEWARLDEQKFFSELLFNERGELFKGALASIAVLGLLSAASTMTARRRVIQDATSVGMPNERNP